MCATCGCSGTIGEGTGTAAEGHPESPALTHGHVHHDHDHDHEHGHGHAHPHPHVHDPGYHHAHDHGHGHLERVLGQDHGHAHEHAVDPAVVRTVQLEREILAKNRLLAERNRGWLEGREVFAVNLMSSPGSGKTTLLERTIRELGGQISVSVVEGDQETRLDAERIGNTGAQVIQINTGTGCHLDAQMLARALHQLVPPPGSLLFVENVGNLVCPALFDLGEGARVVIASTTEGEDKPLKYPHMFRTADLVLLNKVDLLPHLTFDPGRFVLHLRAVNPTAKLLLVSATRGDGLPEWTGWLTTRASVSQHAV
jgi:hydrogenase nickel incorporation protein HypB